MMSKLKFILALATACGLWLMTTACGGTWSSGAHPASSSTSARPAAPLPPGANESSDEAMVRFLEERVKQDPEDFSALNKLAGLYLRRVRETGNVEYLDLARRAARASLKSVPEISNASGLAALTEIEFSSHEFESARDHANRLIELDPSKAYPYGMLGDALLELGEYDRTTAAYRQMERHNDGLSDASETRLARLALLYGDQPQATRRLSNALALLLDRPAPPREAVAWTHWQLGEVAFATGDYETAEGHYRESLKVFPEYYRAHAGVGRVLEARGDLAGAIASYEQLVKRLPDPAFIATLGDLYKLAGREKEAATQYQLVEQIARLNAASVVLYTRQLALFYADHDMQAEAAYASAAAEYKIRRDIYGADAVAWTALKANKLPEAQMAMREALRLGTKDAMLLYHAAMIARAAGDPRAAGDYLERALKLNPHFAPLQSALARQALAG